MVNLTDAQLAQLEPVFKELEKALKKDGPGPTIAAQLYRDGMRVAFLNKRLTDAFMVALGTSGRLAATAHREE